MFLLSRLTIQAISVPTFLFSSARKEIFLKFLVFSANRAKNRASQGSHRPIPRCSRGDRWPCPGGNSGGAPLLCFKIKTQGDVFPAFFLQSALLFHFLNSSCARGNRGPVLLPERGSPDPWGQRVQPLQTRPTQAISLLPPAFHEGFPLFGEGILQSLEKFGRFHCRFQPVRI